MTQFESTINKLAALSGLLTDSNELLIASKLQDDIKDSEMELDAMKDMFQQLQVQLESAQTELYVQEEQLKQFPHQAIENLENAKKRVSILETYIITVSGEEFIINQVARKSTDTNNQYWQKLKLLTDRARLVRDELTELRGLQKRCDELKQQID